VGVITVTMATVGVMAGAAMATVGAIGILTAAITAGNRAKQEAAPLGAVSAVRMDLEKRRRGGRSRRLGSLSSLLAFMFDSFAESAKLMYPEIFLGTGHDEPGHPTTKLTHTTHSSDDVAGPPTKR
jgi:hypothetical protein